MFQNSANSGHITGMAVLDDSRVLTCSVDQRVSLWKICQPANLSQLANPSETANLSGLVEPSQLANPFQLVWQTFSHVPDLHDIVVHRHLSGGKVFAVVVGAGMQIFEINNKS